MAPYALLPRYGEAAVRPWQESKPKQVPTFTKSARGKAVAATVHPLATEAALQMMREGGNAIDAIVAAAVTLSVVDGHNSGIGGGCFLLIRSSQGEVFAIDGREKAPAAAKHDMFLRNGKPDTKLSQTGPLACGIPGEIAALELAHKRLGKLPWARLFQPAIEAAEEGYVVELPLPERSTMSKHRSNYFQRCSDVTQCIWSSMETRERLRQSDLAKTMKKIASQGSDWFYRGEFAERVASYLQSIGGIATKEDFAADHAKLREPLKTNYRGNTILGFPPPSSGGIHVAQMLTMLERFSLKQLYQDRPLAFYHVLAESMKLAFADRAFWLGDSDFAKVPRGLVDPNYAAELSARIDLEKIAYVPTHGNPPQADSAFFGDRKHTTHLTTADNEGTGSQ